MAKVSDDEKPEVYGEFKKLMNMTASSLEKHLQTDGSKKVGYKGDGDESKESVGHQSGERIVEILHKHKADLDDDDYAHMRKVAGYIKRHSAQEPDARDPESRWALSLKNWGHDPYKGDQPTPSIPISTATTSGSSLGERNCPTGSAKRFSARCKRKKGRRWHLVYRQHRFHENRRVEVEQIINSLPDADQFNRQAELLPERNHHAAPRRAV